MRTACGLFQTEENQQINVEENRKNFLVVQFSRFQR